MYTIKVKRLDTPAVLVIGARGEYGARCVEFPLADLIAEYGEGTAVLLHRRAEGEDEYTVPTLEGETRDWAQQAEALTWYIGRIATTTPGEGVCELQWYTGGTLKKSFTYVAKVLPSINDTGGVTDAQQSYIDQMAALAADIGIGARAAEIAASAAETAQHAAESARETAVDAAATAEGDAANAQQAAEAAEASADVAEDHAEDSEAWAIGTRAGVAVPDTDPAYLNNSKFWADTARERLEAAGAGVVWFDTDGEGRLYMYKNEAAAGLQFTVEDGALYLLIPLKEG